MSEEYTRDQMLQWLEQYFKSRGYVVDTYSGEFLPARVPLYCKKKKGNKTEEVVIEITTDKIIRRDDFFPSLHIDSVEIPEASPVRFYQYYFPKTMIFYAYPDYVEENDEFIKFKTVCEKRGIGLLKTSKTETKEVLKSHSLFSEICTQLVDDKKTPEEIEEIIGDYLENYLHYLVYYPDPVYRRRAISRRTKKDREIISFTLIDKLSELRNIIYRDDLMELSSGYRQKSGDDYDIAEKYVTTLWKNYLGLDYPNIQRRVENILQRDEKYREHFVHLFQVFLIGAYILDTMYSGIASKFKEKYDCNIETVWLAASTFHDFNYGLQNFDTWLVQFFEDTLRIKSKQTKENLNLLNLDAAMIREALYDKLTKIVNQLNCKFEDDEREKIFLFFYEKAVRDRNHGVLSAISLLKLYDDSDQENERSQKSIIIGDKGILQAALAIGCHDEDIWEALCGCLGYRRSPSKLPEKEDDCITKCGRQPWQDKKSRIYKQKISDGVPREKIEDYRCESWERALMEKRIMEEISFEEYPIVFLLILCDTVQDEGRVTSSSEDISKDRSTHDDIIIKKEGSKICISIKLLSEDKQDKEEKEDEVERVSWCLKDERFKIYVNDECKKMSGKR